MAYEAEPARRFEDATPVRTQGQAVHRRCPDKTQIVDHLGFNPEVFNVIEADAVGCHIITAPADVLKKLPALGSMSASE
jgi:hypothetical protein